MGNYLKDMFIEVREKNETISPLTELEQMMASVTEVLYGASVIEEAAREGFSVRLSLPRLTPNESWGDPDSQSRKDIDRIFASITRKGTIKERIDHINSFADPVRAQRKGTGKRFNTILNMMMILESLQACLNDYSESSSGFVFEGFMAAVTGGKQIAGRVGGTLPIEDFVAGDGEPVSLKLLSPKTPIHGSFTNLIDYLFIRGGTGVDNIKYLIGRKNSDDAGSVTQLMLLEFVINRRNFVEIMLASGNQDLLGDQAKALQNLAVVWKGSEEEIIKMRNVLLRTPGYNQTLGMFKKNVDDQGGFNPEASKPKDPIVKQKQYAGEKGRAERLSARKQGKADAAAGKEPDFESWLETNPEYKDPQTKQQKSDYNKALKMYNAGYAEYKPEQPEQPEPLAESYFGEFHEREKLMMEHERALMEAKGGTGGKQWSISAAATDKLANIADVDYYGELNLSDENIKACTDIYIELMGENLVALLKTTEEFTKNIGKYFSADRRSTAMNANIQAQDDGKAIVDTLAAEQTAGQKKDDIE